MYSTLCLLTAERKPASGAEDDPRRTYKSRSIIDTSDSDSDVDAHQRSSNKIQRNHNG